jgi:hypothetical protein
MRYNPSKAVSPKAIPRKSFLASSLSGPYIAGFNQNLRVLEPGVEVLDPDGNVGLGFQGNSLNSLSPGALAIEFDVSRVLIAAPHLG